MPDRMNTNTPAADPPTFMARDGIYATTTRLLHWVAAALVLLTWPLGLMIGFAKKEVVLDFYIIHESFGLLVLWIMLVRVGN